MNLVSAFAGQPFTGDMARAAGISRDQLRRLVATSQVRTPLYGVYVDVSAPDSLALRARAAALVLPRHAVVADRCAAWLHGVDVLDFEELDITPDLDVVAFGGHAQPRRRGVFGGKRDLLSSEVMRIDGVPVTTPVRTACDIACLRGRFRALATIDEFRRVHELRLSSLMDMYPRYVGRRGAIQLRELVPLSTFEADSQPESWTRLMIHDEGLPMPSAQAWVLLPDWGWVRVENAYEHLRIAVEYDGERHHTLGDDVEHDAARRDALADADWIILVIRKGDFSAKRRMLWLAELASAIGERSPERPAKRIYARGPDHPAYRWKPRS